MYYNDDEDDFNRDITDGLRWLVVKVLAASALVGLAIGALIFLLIIRS